MTLAANSRTKLVVHPPEDDMPISDRLANKILEVFGEEAGHDMLDWMRRIEARQDEILRRRRPPRQGVT